MPLACRTLSSMPRLVTGTYPGKVCEVSGSMIRLAACADTFRGSAERRDDADWVIRYGHGVRSDMVAVPLGQVTAVGPVDATQLAVEG